MMDAEKIVKEIVSRNQYKKGEMVCVAGVPGAGKSFFINSSDFESFIKIDPDLFRKYAPNYCFCNNENVIKMTKCYVDNISESLLRTALREKYSFVLASTFADTLFWKEIFTQIKPLVYEYYQTKRLIVLKQPYEECKKGCEKRSSVISRSEPKPRLWDEDFFNRKVKEFDKGIDFLVNLEIFNEMIIYSRNKLNDVYHIVEVVKF